MTAFFTLHRDLPREGPGEPADVNWAVEQGDLPARAEIADVACGPGS
ncbi:MAG TPA: class I SAM-dependent methyltransferase, partial [Sulfitobacter sp.]|nr:class I SAM-dependent methyltransferase [Sulfitobacter sp.]